MAYFETVKSFADVSIRDDGVETLGFLEASDGLVNMFDLLGSGIFGFVQTDLRTNISGVRDRYNANKDVSETLEKLVKAERDDGHKFATGCLVKLLRGLSFTCRALQNMQSDEKAALHTCFKRSYDKTLSNHHPMAVRMVVTVAIRAVPHRPDFYARISQSSPTDHERHRALDAELAKWLAGLEALVRHMKTFLEEGGMGKVSM